MVEGEQIRDWLEPAGARLIFPYNEAALASDLEIPLNYLWLFRSNLRNRIWFRKTQDERGLQWWEYGFLSNEIALQPLLITFAFVATHNHFVLDRGGKVFKQSAPVIKLPSDATEYDHMRLLGLLNSSTSCFWMKQVFYPKATATGDISTEKGKPEANRYEFAGTELLKFPIPEITKNDSDALAACRT